jgi:hypothetical protein
MVGQASSAAQATGRLSSASDAALMYIVVLPHIAAALGIHASAQRIHETDDFRGLRVR